MQYIVFADEFNNPFEPGAALQGEGGVEHPPLVSQSANCYLSRQNWIG